MQEIKNKINTSDIAPDFTAQDSEGNKITLSSFKGSKKVVLLFLRYYGCPICKFHLSEIKNYYEQFENKNTEILVVMETTIEELKTYKANEIFPFKILSDPQKKLFNLYGVGRGTILKSMLSKNVIGKFIKATVKGNFHGKYNGDDLQLPADFIINNERKIIYCYYGNDIADNTSLNKILEILT